MEDSANAPLWRFTTLKVGGDARRFCQPSSIDELTELVFSLEESNQPWFILGGGSNLLVSSNFVDCTVIRTAQLTSVRSREADVIEADAGARLPHLARYAASVGLSGLEFSVGIPGTVGGAVIMNAGAHGSCMAEIVESVTIYDANERKIVTMSNADLDFSYRRCKLDPKRHVVLSASFKLLPQPKESIEDKTRENEEYRWRTQPLGWPNAGSTFKNPLPDKGAGFLLDRAGAKQLREGQAAVSAVHANFVINMGGATSEQVTALMKRMQECVFSTFEVKLTPEWKTLGEFSEAEQEVWRV